MPDVALRYMTRFVCIAERCEDTCCAGLSVPLDEESLKKVTGLLSADELTEKVEVRTDIPGNVALFRHRPDGHCSFLTSAKRCGLQERHGERALSTACATFPRTINRVGDRSELTGTLSCPEVARLVVRADDALDAVPIERAPSPEATNAWTERRALLREEALAQLAAPYPLSTRLVFLAYLAVEPDALRHRETIAKNIAALDVPSAPWLSVAEELLESRARASSVARVELLRSRLAPVDWSPFVERRDHLAQAHPWAERAFDRIARNAWLRGAGLDGSTAEAIATFVLRLALLRIAWVRQEVPMDRAAAEDCLAETAQILSKYVDASAELLSFRDALCARPPAELFGFLLTLARLQP